MPISPGLETGRDFENPVQQASTSATVQMMRILVTGGTGFVGLHLLAAMHRAFGAAASICVTSKSGGNAIREKSVVALDVTNAGAVAARIEAFQPTHVVHLAALAAVQNAQVHEELAWQVHLFGTLNIANAILRHAPECTLMFVGSGQVYGATARNSLPLDEDALLAPTNTYAVTKAAADIALGAMAEQGLHCLRLRPFNHSGVGQTEDFVIPSFAMQIARIEAGLQPPVIKVGNLDAERDFLDVRDVAEMYVASIARSRDIKAGAIYNIASGIPRQIAAVLDSLIAMSDSRIEISYDPTRMRPADTPSFVGDASRARRDLQWVPRIGFDETLQDILRAARLQVAAAG